MDKPNQKARRSSILKLPRQKYSDEEQEESTAIESTIARNKRRVSFASSNFVKPFVSDPDQNTIWDTTYEEAVDHTNSTRSSQDLASVQSVNETGSIAKNSLNADDIEMMDIDEDINTTLLDTTQHVDFTNMSFEEIEIMNVADKENIVPFKCHRGRTVDFVNKLDLLKHSSLGVVSANTIRDLTYQNSENIYITTTAQGFEIPVDHSSRKSVNILHHTTSLTENIYQGPVDLIKPTLVCLNDVSNISIGRHHSIITRQHGNERLTATSSKIQPNCSVGSVEASTSSKAETYHNQSASLLSSDSTSAMDLTCEDPDIELGKLISDNSLKASSNQIDMEFTCQILTEKKISLDKNLLSMLTSQAKESTSQDLSSMELTCQIPTGAIKSIAGQLLQESTRQNPTENINKSINQDLSSMEFTCQFPTEQRKSHSNNLSSIQIMNQTRKSIAKDSSSLQFTCQVPTKAGRSLKKDQSLKELQTESVEPAEQDLSSMEFTCQIPTKEEKAFGSDLSSTEITNQINSVGKDSSSMEFTCQIPTDARRSINKNQTLQGSRTENVLTADQDISSMKFTCQIENEQTLNVDNQAPTETSSQRTKSFDKDLSSMEFTCQIPTDARRSINQNQTLQGSRTDNVLAADQDISSMKFTCQIENEQTLNVDNQAPTETTSQRRKSFDKELSSTCQIPTDPRRSINKDQSLQESQSECVQPVGLDISSMEFTSQISSTGKESPRNDLPPVQIMNQIIESTAQDLSYMEFSCQIPNDARKSLDKNQSLEGSQTENVQPVNKDLSSMEFTCQIQTEQKSIVDNLAPTETTSRRKKSCSKDSSSMEFTCQIPTDARSINRDQSLKESQTGNVQPVDLDLSSMEFTCQIPPGKRKSLSNDLLSVQITNRTIESAAQDSSSMEFTCQIPTDARKSLNKNQSLQGSQTENVQPVNQDLSSMEFTCQIQTEQKSIVDNLAPTETTSRRKKSCGKDSSSMEFTCQIPTDARSIKDQSLQESQSGNVQPVDFDLSSMEFTCQIPYGKRKSLCNDLSSVQISNQAIKSTVQDLSSMEFTYQIPTDARRSINKNRPSQESRTENVQPVDQDLDMEFTCQVQTEQKSIIVETLSPTDIESNSMGKDSSSMEFTCQIPTVAKRSINKDRSLQDLQSEIVQPIDLNLSSMEFTCQIPSSAKDPTRIQSYIKNQSLQESICQTATENKPAHDLSSMKVISQNSTEQRKSLDKSLSLIVISNQTRKSAAQDLSRMELTCKDPTGLKKDQSSLEPVCQLTTESIKEVGQDLSFIDLTSNISVEKRKSIDKSDKNRSLAEFAGQNQILSRTLPENDLPSMDFLCRISSQNKKSLDKNQSALEITCQKSSESTKWFDHNLSSKEFNEQVPSGDRKPLHQNQSALEITCQKSSESTKQFDHNLSSKEFNDQEPTDDRKPLHQNQSALEITCQKSSESTKQFDHNLSSKEFNDQEPTDNRKPLHQNQSSMEFTNDNWKYMGLLGQIPSETRNSVDKNQTSNLINHSPQEPSCQMTTKNSKLADQDLSSMKLTCQIPVEKRKSIEGIQSFTEFADQNQTENRESIDKGTNDMLENISHSKKSISKDNSKSFNSGTQNQTLEKHQKSDIADSSIYNVSRNVLEKTMPKLEDSRGGGRISSDVAETSVFDRNKRCISRTSIDDLGGTMTMADLTYRRQHFTDLNQLERSVVPVKLVDDETENNLFLIASSQPKVDDCKNEEMKATNILYSQKFSDPKLLTGEKPISDLKTPITSFHMTLTPNLTMLDSQMCNLTKSFPDLLTTVDNVDLNNTSFMPHPKEVMRISLPPMEPDDSHFLDHFKCSLVDENDQLISDTSEIGQDNKLMHVNDTYVLKTKSNVTHDNLITEMDNSVGNSDKTFAKSNKLSAKNKSFTRSDQTFAKSDQTFAKSDPTYVRSDQTSAKTDQTFAKTDQTFAKTDQTFAKTDQTFAKTDQTFAKTEQTFAKTDQTPAKIDRTYSRSDQTFARADHTFVRDRTDVELKTQQSCCQELRKMNASSKNSEAFKRCYNLLDNFKASMNILQNGTKLDFNIVNVDDNDRMNRLLSMLENSPTRLTAYKKIEPKLHTFLSTKTSPDKSLHKILHEQRLQIKNYLESFEFKPFNLLEVKTKPGEDTSDGTFENVTEEINAELMSLSINENIEKPVDFIQEIRKLEKKSPCFWNLEEVDDCCKYYFSTLHGCLQFNVDFDQISGIVSNLELKKNMPVGLHAKILNSMRAHLNEPVLDSAHPYAHYVFQLLHEKLSNPSLSSAIGNKYDILSLLEYVHLISKKSLKFHQEYERMQEDGLVIQNMTATFTIIDKKVLIWWNITVDLKQGKLIDVDARRGTALLKSKVADIYNMVKICPKGFDFLFSVINSIKAHLKV